MTQLARWVSIAGHPFVMVALLVVVPAMRQSPGHAVRSLLFVALAVLVPVAILMAGQVRRGRWSNVDASSAAERPVLFAVALAGLLAALGWLLFRDPHSFLVRGLIVVAAFLVVASILTRWVKLSLHVAFAALAATTLSLLGSAVGYALIIMVAALFWSRIVLSRHRVHELLIGLALGVVTGIVLARTTQRIQASTDPQLSFVAQSPGTEFVWVRAAAGPFTGSAEIRIDAAPPGRRRAAKH